MDAHDGRAPKLGELVATDHIISVGAVGPKYGSKVEYSQTIPAAVKSLLPTHVHGKRLPSRIDNGDCFVKTADLHATTSYGDYQNVIIQRGLDYASSMNGWS
jgi:hypothetical protein